MASLRGLPAQEEVGPCLVRVSQRGPREPLDRAMHAKVNHRLGRQKPTGEHGDMPRKHENNA